MSANRIEIYHPGAFPKGLELQDYIEQIEHPVRRNPKIARIFYYSKDIESFGTGLKRIADTCENAEKEVLLLEDQADMEVVAA